MTETSSQRNDLVEAITREVLAALGAGRTPRAPAVRARRPLRRLPARAARPSAPPRSATSWPAARRASSTTAAAADVPGDLARYIDHTLLRPDASAADIDRLCAEAAEHRFAAVCINPTWVRRAAENLRGTDVAVASVIGFPFGATHERGQGPRGAAGHPRRRPRDRHGHQHRGPQERRCTTLVREDIAPRLGRLPRGRRGATR